MEKIFLPIARLSPLAAPAAGLGRGRREEEKELREPWVSRDWALEGFYSMGGILYLRVILGFKDKMDICI